MAEPIISVEHLRFGFGEAVLSLQAGKVDMNFALQATPLRSTAIDFAGPIYWIEWVTVNNPKFNGKVWADYNKEGVKVAVMTGTSDELLLRKMAPKATRVEFKSAAEIAVFASCSGGSAERVVTAVGASASAAAGSCTRRSTHRRGSTPSRYSIVK